ncbi:MAG: 50S ribosomal protein L3 [Candidatus Bathyarchaeia archaeon]|nr:50S ribosomal protein L3 [Candidatus Bathyarchaeota archaeon A05DMB-4]MDH7595857.1 50S ribosomal protein L3 [Candidatus Bathyarchaeota archaeon]
MGHRKQSAPRHGSLAYIPRGRAARPIGKIKYWPTPKTDAPTLLGFMVYKAGMTHVFYVDDTAGSPNFGKEIFSAATILEAPPLLVCGIRAYTRDPYGLRTFCEAWMKEPPDDLNRLATLPEKFSTEEMLKKIEENLDKITVFTLIAATQPRLAGISKKKPDMAEIKIGGGKIKDQFEYAKNLLGKTVSAIEVFKEGQYIDAIAVSKGKGFQGPVKRFGVKLLGRKSNKTHRGVACIGPWQPAHTLYTVARAGQMGYHQRTEYNKRILKIGADGKEVTPKGGFLRYGQVKGPHIIIKGSLPGATKRLIRLRCPARPPKKIPAEPPKIVEVSLKSPQGK